MTQEILKNLLPKFLDYLKVKSRSPSTILAYRADLEQLKEFLQSKNKVLVEQIIQSDLEAFRDTLLTEKYTPKSVSRKLNAVKTNPTDHTFRDRSILAPLVNKICAKGGIMVNATITDDRIANVLV